MYLRKNLAEQLFVYFYFGHASQKRERIFHRIAIFANTKTVVMSVNKK